LDSFGNLVGVFLGFVCLVIFDRRKCCDYFLQ
jgi:hypothetical protein